jgi:hypothetical protein
MFGTNKLERFYMKSFLQPSLIFTSKVESTRVKYKTDSAKKFLLTNGLAYLSEKSAMKKKSFSNTDTRLL